MNLPTKEEIKKFFEKCYFQLGEEFRLNREELENYKPQLQLMSLDKILEEMGLVRSRKNESNDYENVISLARLDMVLTPHYDQVKNLINLYYPVDTLKEKEFLSYLKYSRRNIFCYIAGEIGHALRAIARKYVFTPTCPDMLSLDGKRLEETEEKNLLPFMNISEFFDASAKILSYEIFANSEFEHHKPGFSDFVGTVEDLMKKEITSPVDLLDFYRHVLDFTVHIPYFVAIFTYETNENEFRKLIKNSKPPLIYQTPEEIYQTFYEYFRIFT